MKKVFAVFGIGLITACTVTPSKDGSLSSPEPSDFQAIEAPIVFEANTGETVAAFAGSFDVPENRSVPDSRMLTLRYIRFPAKSTTDAAPIV